MPTPIIILIITATISMCLFGWCIKEDFRLLRKEELEINKINKK